MYVPIPNGMFCQSAMMPTMYNWSMQQCVQYPLRYETQALSNMIDAQNQNCIMPQTMVERLLQQCCCSSEQMADALSRMAQSMVNVGVPRISPAYGESKPLWQQLYEIAFPVDPIRDYIAKRIKEIDEQYAKTIDALSRLEVRQWR